MVADDFRTERITDMLRNYKLDNSSLVIGRAHPDCCQSHKENLNGKNRNANRGFDWQTLPVVRQVIRLRGDMKSNCIV